MFISNSFQTSISLHRILRDSRTPGLYGTEVHDFPLESRADTDIVDLLVMTRVRRDYIRG
jgi:hypothetical protein